MKYGKLQWLGAATVLLAMGCSQENQAIDDDALVAIEAVSLQTNAGYDPASGNMPGNVEISTVAQTAPPKSTGPRSLPAGSVRVQQVQIMDRGGFEKPVVALTMMVPAGWQTQGGVVWRQNMSGCGEGTPSIKWMATAPDGVGMMSILANETWSGNNLPMQVQGQTNCPNVQITDAQQFITSYVQRHRPNARILDYLDRSDDIKEMQQQLQQQQMPDMYGMESRSWAGAGQLLISYQVNGQEVREVIGTAVIFNLMRMQGAMPGEISEFLTISVMPGFSMRMPEGQLDFKQAEMFRNSGKPNPEWQARMAKHNAKMSRINAKGAADRARITSQTNSEISDMQMDSWRKQQVSQDRGAREFSETIREVETYSDTAAPGGSVELDSNYDNAWRLNDGTYVLTDDTSFNPYAATGQDGQKLEPRR